MRFFKFDDSETVVATSEESAIAYYADHSGFSEKDAKEFMEEKTPQERMWCGSDLLTEKEMHEPQIFQQGPSGHEVLLSYEKFCERTNPPIPSVIACTER